MKNDRIYNIHERIYQWVIRVVKYTKKLPNTPQNLIIIKQLAKSVTSVGANDQQADLTHLCDL